MSAADKAARVIEANKLIQIIAKHGRRFFYCAQHDRVSSFHLGGYEGRIYFTDDYTGQAILMKPGTKWEGFSHGGTLRALVGDIAKYIATGTPVPLGWIGPGRADGSNIWGYDSAAMEAVRAEALTTGAVTK